MKPCSKTGAVAVAIALLPTLAIAQEFASPAAELVGTASAPQILQNIPPEFKFMLATLGSGGLTGWAVGFTLKKFAKLAALIVGVAFISLQFLAYNHFISIDWEKIRQTVPNESIEASWTSLVSVLTFNLPFAGAFLVGFWMGFRKG
jgi:uncharacterized membrane protein (Fun14 family)